VPWGLALRVLLRWLPEAVAELLPQPHRGALLALAAAGAAPLAPAQATGADDDIRTSVLVVRWVDWTTTLAAVGLVAVAALRQSFSSRA